MNNPQHAPQVRKQSLEHAKIMLSAVFGAVIGCGASFLAYDTLLGGAAQTEKLSQIERTIEHSRLVGEESLALLKTIQPKANGAGAEARASAELSKQPTQRELTDAIDGLFNGLDEGAPSAVEAAAGKPDEQAQAAAQMKATVQEAVSAEKDVDSQKASNEAETK
jgi:hypothetical protein